jgi:hypothetical protein
MALLSRPGFTHVGAPLTVPEAEEFFSLKELLGVGNRRLITLGIDALRREIEATESRPKLLPRRRNRIRQTESP